MSDELKPCPWEKPGERHELEMVDVGALMWVRCATCMAAGPCEKSREDAAAAWNARAAVTDEQFAIAVHDGEAWQRVRECRNIGCETGDDFKCSACGEAYNESDDMAMPASRIDWCFSCGAKVVG